MWADLIIAAVGLGSSGLYYALVQKYRHSLNLEENLEKEETTSSSSLSYAPINLNLLTDYIPLLDQKSFCSEAYLANKTCQKDQDCQECSGTRCQVIDQEIQTINNYAIMPAPNGLGRCVPEKTGPCNPFSGQPILSVAATGAIFWYCRARYPQVVDKTDQFGDVTKVVACNGLGQLLNPITKVPWASEMNYDPTAATCECPSYATPTNPTSYGTYTGCAVDSCYPGKTDQKGGCICPLGYVACPSRAFSSTEQSWQCPRAAKYGYVTCRPDPCTIGNASYAWDALRGRCNQKENILAGRTVVPNKHIWFGPKVPTRGVTFTKMHVCNEEARSLFG